MEDYYEYLDSNGVTTLYKLIKDDTVALIDSYSVTINGITTNLDNHVNNADIHTPIADIEGMIDTAVGSLNYATPDYVDTKVADLVNSAPGTLDTLKELSDALGNDSNFATTVVNQIGTKANKDDVYTKVETDTLLESKANSEHSHVVSDITDFPTIPTKTSQLINDSGFLTSSSGLITSVSWNDITSKPSFSDIAISGSYNDLVDTPTIPTKTSELANDSGYITSVNWSDITNKPNFSKVATSGSYNDLSNKPTIPNVYNKTLTIQKNGTNVATFTSNSNTDVTADITVPTKVSELSNDSGFITGISWDKVTNKPTLATVATSGSYTDLSNTPIIPTKVSQLENDMGFGTGGDTSDCVHKTGNETINGTKTFTAGPVASNNATTNGYFIKLNAVARNEVPTQLYHATFRAYDKNGKILGEYCIEKSTTGCSLLNMNVRSEDSNGKQLSESLYLNMSNDGSAVRFYPSSDNKMDLGMSNHKWAKIYSDDVVHTSGDETIEGVKTFTQTVNIKNNNLDLAITPTNNVFSTIAFRDKNNITTASLQNSQRTYGVNDICFYVYDNSSKSHGFRIRTDKKLEPIENNTYSLGSSSNKWLKVYSDDVVHTSGNETIAGSKTFSNQIYLGAGGTSYGQISAKDNNSILRLYGGASANTGANLDLYGEGVSSGGFSLRARTSDKIVGLDGKTDGTLKWNGKNVALDENLVHKTGDETIGGDKAFSNTIYRKNTSTDLTVTPTSTQFSRLVQLVDKNDKTLGYIEHAQRSGGNDLSLFVTDKNSGVHGVRLNEYNTLFPMEDNVYNLGLSGSKWANVYATRINCNNIVRAVENSYIYMTAGPAWNSGASIFLNGKSGDGLGTGKGTFLLFARDGTNESRLLGYPNGILSWNGCIESHEFRSITGNAFMAQNGGYTFLIRNDGSNTYFLMSDKDGTPGTWSTARPLMISNATGVCNINGNANSATYATTQATSDNSTKIATTAWVRNYVNSVGGSGNNTIGSSISAYWSTSSKVTDTKQASNERDYPECYSSYINRTPSVGIIYSGAQLYTSLDVSANATGELGGSVQDRRYITKVTAQATFSNPISSTGKYLCTTANTVSFRAYTPGGKSRPSASVIDNTSTKSIFIRVE